MLYLLKNCQIKFTDGFLNKFDLTSAQIEKSKNFQSKNAQGKFDNIFADLKQFYSSREEVNLKYRKAIKFLFSQSDLFSDVYFLWKQLCSANIGFFLHYYRKNIFSKRNFSSSQTCDALLQIISSFYLSQECSYSFKHVTYTLKVSLGLPSELFGKISIDLSFWLYE